MQDTTKDTKRCTWKLGDKVEDSPHTHVPFRAVPKLIYDDALDAIGNTPMIRINKLGVMNGVHCQLLAKCQFMNVGGSIKDRIGKRMVLDGEKQGVLKAGDTIVEASSGNTGIGIALASAVRGYDCIITLPEKMSAEKANVLKGLGAKVIRTPTEAPSQSPQSHIGLSLKLKNQGCVLLDQYCNPSNSIAHYDQLGQEVLHQCQGKLDAIVIGVGTGGSIAGIARKIKEKCPHAIVVGADPYGSVLAIPSSLNTYAPPNKVQGIGYDFVPRTCARECVDEWVKTDDQPSFLHARDLIRKEGLLVGGSSGAVLSACFQFIRKKGWENDKTKRVVCVFSDSVRNYITKFLSKEWCIENQFLPYEELIEKEHPFHGVSIAALELPTTHAVEEISVGEAKGQFQKGAKIILLKKNEEIDGVLTPSKFLELVTLKKLKLEDSATKAKTREFVIVPHTLDVGQLSKQGIRIYRILERHAVVVVEERREKKIQKLWLATPADTFKLMK